MDEPKWRREFNALPIWVQKLVRGLAGSPAYVSGPHDFFRHTLPEESQKSCVTFQAALRNENLDSWMDGFHALKGLADAMTAPWPPPIPAPHKDMTTGNVVEMIALGEDGGCAFDQPCHYGHRVESHAVYCHNNSWLGSPRKCHRNREDFRHEDCPGFFPNAARYDH